MFKNVRGFKTSIMLVFVLLFTSIMLPAGQHASAAPNFAKGADISWVPGMEAQGYKWKDKNGVQRDIIDILKKTIKSIPFAFGYSLILRMIMGTVT